MTPQIDHEDALNALDTAYQMLCEFQILIDNALDGDHQMSKAIDYWLTWYEKASGTSANLDAAMIEGVPVMVSAEVRGAK